MERFGGAYAAGEYQSLEEGGLWQEPKEEE